MDDPDLTPRQRKWFDSVRAGLERDTGKDLAAWVVIARTCPETGHRARVKWFKETHGLMQNRASWVLGEAFGSGSAWSDPNTLIDALWTDAGSRAIYEAVDARARALTDMVRSARKGYTAWSRNVQFAAARPVKGGGARLGLAVSATADPSLEARGRESWSERLASSVTLDSPEAVERNLDTLLRLAWEKA
ncbi:MAG TPA: DUF5655 domain-containing protein [Caulobacteraceae bacterium]|nr:DUF5655 domain-containing protein [Caulobacteraceae bacterium]